MLVVPTRDFPRALSLVSAVNSGREVFLLDTSAIPTSLVINPIRKKGGKRLKIGQQVYVTNQARIWLVKITRGSHGYFAKVEHSACKESDPSRIEVPRQRASRADLGTI
jgi:hypothetical protein